MGNGPGSFGRSLGIFALVLGSSTLGSIRGLAQVSVPTYHNDDARTGLIQELVLTPANVNPAQFGRLFSHRVDGYVYAQPLYVPNVSVPGRGAHNVIFVATEHDSLYAFDADDRKGSNAGPLWKRSFIKPTAGITSVPSRDTGCTDLVPEIGITGTPAIDTTTATLYVVVETKEHGGYLQRLHALDITTGQDKLGSPVQISASVLGGGDGSSGGMVAFDALKHNQRPGLLLANGLVYIAWASHCDIGPYHGWIMAYDAGSLAQVAVFNATPDGGLGGIWQSGGGLAADAGGNVYAVTGNGTFDADVGGADYGDSVLKLDGGTLAVEDYFTPFDQAALDAADADLGSGGALLLPDQPAPPTHLLVTAGKEGTIYLLDRDNMGHFNPVDDSQIVQSLPGAISGSFDTPAFWNEAVYYAGPGDEMFAFGLTGGRLSTTPITHGVQGFDFPGATPTLSANGSTNAITWVIQRDLSTNPPRAVLRAYDATDLTVELYNSLRKRTRDSIGGAVKFAVPTVANGKVYVGARKRISVFGLL